MSHVHLHFYNVNGTSCHMCTIPQIRLWQFWNTCTRRWTAQVKIDVTYAHAFLQWKCHFVSHMHFALATPSRHLKTRAHALAQSEQHWTSHVHMHFYNENTNSCHMCTSKARPLPACSQAHMLGCQKITLDVTCAHAFLQWKIALHVTCAQSPKFACGDFGTRAHADGQRR